MSKNNDLERFKNLSFDDFRKLAGEQGLSMYQKIGFPDSYRKGIEREIFHDIVNKLGLAEKPAHSKGCLLDIGPGCSELPKMIIEHAQGLNLDVLLVDSQEMLTELSPPKEVSCYEGYFPDSVPQLMTERQGSIDFIVAYSIFHYVFYHTCIYRFLDSAVSLLRPGGKMLIGDIPNISKRRRFFSTESGITFHQAYTQTETLPVVDPYQVDSQMDDGVLMGIMQRYRGFGLEVYVLPQPPSLPFHNRREDLLIHKV